MNPIFLISNIEHEFIKGENFGPVICRFDGEKGTALDQYLDFRSDLFKLNKQKVEIYNNEILLVCIRDLSKQEDTSFDIITELSNDNVFGTDVRSIFLIDIWNGLASNINIKALSRIEKGCKDVKEILESEVFNIVLSKENTEAREITVSDIYTQVENLLFLLGNNYSNIYNYFKPSHNNTCYLNAFGSAALLMPEGDIERAVTYLNNASQLQYILSNKALSNSMLYDVSSKIGTWTSKNDLQDVLAKNFSQAPERLHVAEMVNEVYAKCQIDSLDKSFEKEGLTPFTGYTRQKMVQKETDMRATHSGYLSDVTHRISDAYKDSERYFKDNEVEFSGYKAEVLLGMQKTLNSQKRNKIRDIAGELETYSNSVIQTASTDANAKFERTTPFEVLIEIFAGFVDGAGNDDEVDFSALQKKKLSISEKNGEARATDRKTLQLNFDIVKRQLKEKVLRIDEELEEKKRTSGFKDLIAQRKQLTFEYNDANASMFGRKRYSFVQWLAIVLASVIGGIWLAEAIVAFFVVDMNLFTVAVLASIGAVAIGGLYFFGRVVKYRNSRTRLEDQVSKKIGLLTDYMGEHDIYVRNYLEHVKIEYTLDVLAETKRYCDLKVYKLNSFRLYVLNHYLYSIAKYNNIDFDSNVFGVSLINKEAIEKAYFNESFMPYFEKSSDVRLEFYNLYVEKSKNRTDYEFEAADIAIDYFDESETVTDKISAVNGHTENAEFHNNHVEEPVLYLANEGEKIPITLSDIKQGNIGNCYFMAALGAIADTNPSHLRKMIIGPLENNDSIEEGQKRSIESYLVRFFDAKGNAKYVAVDNRFWFNKNDGNPLYAQYGSVSSKNCEIWPMVIEKAWAKVNKGYEFIVGEDRNAEFKDRQGKLNFGLALSGNHVDYREVGKYESTNDMLDWLAGWKKRNKPLALYSKSEPINSEVIASHAYTIEDITPDHISLYNPHGRNHLKLKSPEFIQNNFDKALVFHLENVSELVIPPSERVLSIKNIEEIEGEFNSYFGDDLVSKMKKMYETVSSNKEEMKSLVARIDRAALPLFNSAALKDSYSIMFTDYEHLSMEVLKSVPNDKQPKVSSSIQLLLAKFISWELKV